MRIQREISLILLAFFAGCGGGGGNTTTHTLSLTAAGPGSVSSFPTGGGTVTSNPPGINCPGNCTANFASGSTVTLAVTPACGATFSNWSGGCTGSGACSLSLAADQNVTAAFSGSASSHRITVKIAG